MASTAQIKFFDNLLEQRVFPDGTKTDKLRSQFATLQQKNASDWIEAALKLPEKDDADPDHVPPPFG